MNNIIKNKFEFEKEMSNECKDLIASKNKITLLENLSLSIKNKIFRKSVIIFF